MSKAWRIFFVYVFFLFGPLTAAEPSTGSEPVESPATPPAQPAAPAYVIPAMTNLDEIAKQLKVAEFKGKKFSRKLKVAILDNGFSGWEQELGKDLPKDTVYHNGKASDADRNETVSFHGLFMAKILTQVIAKSGAQADYELHLFNAFGYTKFADAVETVVREKFDIVLYAQVWEFGGNGDGKGFINNLVTKAVEAGVLWVNAAGNFGRLTYKSRVDGKVEGTDEWAQFRDGKGKSTDSVKMFCKAPAKEKCSLRLVLAWNDFKEDAETGTDKDLDLFVLDAKGNVVVSSERNQKLTKDPSDKMASMFPRELIEPQAQQNGHADPALLDSGTYSIKVKIKSKNFSASQDQLRLTLSGPHLSFESPTVGETLLPPADHPGVLVVGASDDVQTNQSKTLKKPDISVKSLVKLKDGSAPFSTSNAAAMVAGVAILHLGTGVENNRAAVVAKLKSIDQKLADPRMIIEPGPGEQLEPRRQEPRQPRPPARPPAPERGGDGPREQERDCLRSMSPEGLYPAALRLVNRGGALQRLRGRWVIYAGPQMMRTIDLHGMDEDQRLFVVPNRLIFVGPEDMAHLDPEAIEIVPTRKPICGGETSGPSWMK